MEHFGFIGFGLIGGSIARALKKNFPACRITAYNRHIEVLEQAKADGIVDVVSQEIGPAFSDCDLIFLCAPVETNNENLLRVRPYLGADTVLTDVGSVKTPIHQAAAKAGLEGRFIGGHPMAGSERIGYAAAKDSLLQNAYYILTPTEQIPQKTVEEMRDILSALGALPLILSYEEHDRIVAGISHLPHVVAASLVNLVRTADQGSGMMKQVAAGGFKDITRIASSSPEMWEQICLTNGENIKELLDLYIRSLEQARELIDRKEGERIYSFFDEARTYRNSFVGSASGPILRHFDLTVDIADEPGALAAIATLLALASISIKNIGILHNREYLGGDLRVEFYDEESKEKAAALLTARGYEVHRRAE